VYSRHVLFSSNVIAIGDKTFIPTLIKRLKREAAGDILVVGGGLIPPKDYDFLISAILGSGTNIPPGRDAPPRRTTSRPTVTD